MDTITHSLAGALIGHALGSERNKKLLSTKKRMLCGAIAAAFPDIDYVTTLINPLLFITYWHRGITHSVIMLPFWALILGVLIALLTKQLNQWRACVVISVAVLISHIVLDVLTSWDVRIFAPLSDYRVSLRYVFVIDPIVTGIVLVALVSAYYLRARWISLSSIVVLTGYIIALSILQHNATKIAERAAQDRNWKYEEIAVLPQPFSPFYWKLIVSDDSGHWLAFVNLASDYSGDIVFNTNETIFSIPHYYRSKHDFEWTYFPRFVGKVDAITVWKHPKFNLFRKFAHFPAASAVNISNSDSCFWFLDLRFFIPVIDTPFQYGMCRSPSKKKDWALYRIKNFSDHERELVNLSRNDHYWPVSD